MTSAYIDNVAASLSCSSRAAVLFGKKTNNTVASDTISAKLHESITTLRPVAAPECACFLAASV